jgi:hypothetical protein
MKNTRSLVNSLLACAIACAMVSTVAAQDGGAKVVRIKGPARYSTGNNVWQPLKAGMVLKPGSVIQTGTESGSFVDLVLGDVNAPIPQTAVAYRPHIPNSMSTSMAYRPSAEQNVVRVWENSALGIDRLTAMHTGAEVVTDTQLDLKMGRITGNVKKMSAASKYEIKLPNGVAGIRGTFYDITAEGIVKVYVGSVVVAWVNPQTGNVQTQVVMGGQQYDARTQTLTAIPQAEMETFSSLVATIGMVGVSEPTTFASDKTIITVSPVVGPGPPVPTSEPPPTPDAAR